DRHGAALAGAALAGPADAGGAAGGGGLLGIGLSDRCASAQSSVSMSATTPLACSCRVGSAADGAPVVGPNATTMFIPTQVKGGSPCFTPLAGFQPSCCR